MRKIHRAFFIVLVLVNCAAAQRAVSPLALVPEKSLAVLRVNWTQVRASERLKRVVGGENFARLSEQTGVQESKITEWVVFSNIDRNFGQESAIVVAGVFSAESVAAFARSKDWRAEKIGALTAFVNPADGSRLLPVRNGLLVAGAKTSVEKAHEAFVKPRSRIGVSEPFASVWRKIDAARQPIGFYAGIPQEYQKVADLAFKIATKLMGWTSFGILGKIFETIGLVRSVGFTVSYNKGVLPVELAAMMDSETKAWIAAGALNLLKKAPSAINRKPRDAEEEKMLKALDTMSASYQKEIVSVRFEMPEDALIKP
jgi:hypothetical protein